MRLLTLSLAVLVGLAGALVVPAHVPTIWMDNEFTGWVTPVANRIAEGALLYGEGLHTPIPPWSYVLSSLLLGREALWWHESLLCFTFLMSALLLTGLSVTRLWNARVAYVATVGGMGLFLSFGKTVLYDSMAHFFVALILVALCYLEKPFMRTVVAGLLLSALLLTKQSTGTGVFLGLSLAVTFDRRSWKGLAVLWASTLVGLVVQFILIGPWIESPQALWQDVFLSGASLKGGFSALLFRVLTDFAQLLAYLAMSCLILGASGFRARQTVSEESNRTGTTRIVLVWLTGIWALTVYPSIGYPYPSISEFILWFALSILFFDSFGGLQNGKPGVVLVAFFAALGHALSAEGLRPFTDTNPLAVLALAALAARLIDLPPSCLKTRFKGVAVLPALLPATLCFFCWLHAAPQLAEVGRCEVSAPDIKRLQGAKLRPRVQPLLKLVEFVRANSGPNDLVLVLPEDAEFHSWLERPRPSLSSAVLFYDTYHDSQVEQDLEKLIASPPQIIVWGPVAFSPKFARWLWLSHNENGYGTGRLMNSLQDGFLEKNYEKPVDFEILHGRGTDIMRVYVRRKTEGAVRDSEKPAR